MLASSFATAFTHVPKNDHFGLRMTRSRPRVDHFSTYVDLTTPDVSQGIITTADLLQESLPKLDVLEESLPKLDSPKESVPNFDSPQQS